MTTSTQKTVIPKDVQLEVSKAITQIDFVSRSYQLGIWDDPNHKNAWMHDLNLMRLHDDLKEIRLELIGHDLSVLFEMRLKLGQLACDTRFAADSAAGVELPMLDRKQIASHRVLVDRRGKDDFYRAWLQLNWQSAKLLNRRPGKSFDSEHARKITGGRLNGSFHVDEKSVCQLRVYQTGGKGYAFAESTDGRGMANVFCHEKFANGLKLTPGQLIRAVVVQTPRGLQARSIQRA